MRRAVLRIYQRVLKVTDPTLNLRFDRSSCAALVRLRRRLRACGKERRQ